VHGFERQSLQNEHVQRTLDEITGLISHKSSSSWQPRGEYTSHPVCQEENHGKDTLGQAPLHFAALNGYKDVAGLLLANKAEVNARTSVIVGGRKR
jgi:hypothetical protein